MKSGKPKNDTYQRRTSSPPQENHFTETGLHYLSAEKHHGRDVRKESYRPRCDTLRLGREILTSNGDWSERARYALAKKAQSMEELAQRQLEDRTSLGVIRPKRIIDLVVTRDAPDWKQAFHEALKQGRIFDDRTVTKHVPRKVPFKFQYVFECEDDRCKGHRQMIEDWEVGALYWKLVDQGAAPDEAAAKVRQKFLDELCAPTKDTHFYVGTILGHPRSWVIIGVFYPTIRRPQQANLRLFE
jgi:hypothetical protein